MAYSCDDNTICLIDFNRPSGGIFARFASPDPEGIAFSSDSTELATISRTSDLAVWDLTLADHPKEKITYPIRGFGIGLLSERTIVTIDGSTAIITSSSQPPRVIEARNALATTISSDHHLFAIATMQGVAITIRGVPSVTIQHQQLCDGPLKTLHFIAQSDILAYGCKDGKVGVWHTATLTQKSLAIVQGSANELSSSKDGRYLAIGSSSGILSIVDLVAGVTSTRAGHSGRISAITPLDISPRFFASSDLYGNIRVWETSPSLATIRYTAFSRLFDVRFLPDNSTLVTTSVDPYLHIIGDDFPKNIDHEPRNIFLGMAPDGDRFLAFGSSKNIEVWDGKHALRAFG